MPRTFTVRPAAIKPCNTEITRTISSRDICIIRTVRTATTTDRVPDRQLVGVVSVTAKGVYWRPARDLSLPQNYRRAPDLSHLSTTRACVRGKGTAAQKSDGRGCGFERSASAVSRRR
jgi:hypothetical protein